MLLRGVLRVHRAVGLAGALLLGLLAAYRLTEPVTKLIQRWVPIPRKRLDVLVYPSQPNGQFRSYLAALAITLAGVAIFAVVSHLARRHRRLSMLWSAVTVLAAWLAALVTAPFFGRAALVLMVPLTVLLLAATSRVPLPDRASPPCLLDIWALVGQSVALFWGVWITAQGRGQASLVMGAIVVAAFCAVRTLRLVKAPPGSQALRRDAIAGLPLLALPLAGILRAPSMLFVAAALAMYMGVRVAEARSSGSLSRVPRGLPAVAAVWALTAIYSIPHKFRELPRINHNSHESGNYAWLNSYYHGKLFMADTAMIYGPLREFALAVYVAIAGKTAEQVRAGQILIHLGFLAVMLLMGWVVGRRRLWALGLCALLVITTTMALTWLDAVRLLAFGWSDLGRMAFPMLTIFGALAWARRPRALAGWGAAAALSALYSQETGPTAIVAICLTLVVDSCLRPQPPAVSARARATTAASRVGMFLAGVAGAWLVVIGVYAAFGKAKLFLSTVYMVVTLFASGSLGGVPFPVSELSFASWATLLAGAPHEGFILEYLLPVAVYAVAGAALVATAILRRWSPRATLMLGLLAFGVASFKVAMGRCDYYHLINATAPAVLLLVALFADAADALASILAPRRFLAGYLVAVPLLVVPLLYGCAQLSGFQRAFKTRTWAMLEGKEVPSIGPRFVYPDIPRAGDIFLPPDTLALTRAIQKRSGPHDKVFLHAAFSEHAELYFLADRVNPTRCDLIAEIVSKRVQEEVRQDLVRDPPVLDVGADMGMFNQATVAYLHAGWREVERVGRVPVSVRVSPPPPPR